MKYNKIILAGGSGYLGTVLARHYKPLVKEIIILTRGRARQEGNVRFVSWDGRLPGEGIFELNNADLLVNLTGKSVNCRYNEKNKQEIFDSRTDATEVLGTALNSIENPPPVWINAASATIYRHAEDHPMDEETGETGKGFSVEVCKKWEEAFNDIDAPGTRKVIIRSAIVFGKESEVMKRLKMLAKLGLGGRMGDGKQMVSWIYEEDFARAVELLHTNESLSGVFNLSSPNPLKNEEMMRLIRKKAGVPFGIPQPKWLLEIGAFLIRTETELILKSRWVLPKHLLDAGFKFKYPEFAEAVNAM